MLPARDDTVPYQYVKLLAKETTVLCEEIGEDLDEDLKLLQRLAKYKIAGDIKRAATTEAKLTQPQSPHRETDPECPPTPGERTEEERTEAELHPVDPSVFRVTKKFSQPQRIPAPVTQRVLTPDTVPGVSSTPPIQERATYSGEWRNELQGLTLNQLWDRALPMEVGSKQDTRESRDRYRDILHAAKRTRTEAGDIYIPVELHKKKWIPKEQRRPNKDSEAMAQAQTNRSVIIMEEQDLRDTVLGPRDRTIYEDTNDICNRSNRLLQPNGDLRDTLTNRRLAEGMGRGIKQTPQVQFSGVAAQGTPRMDAGMSLHMRSLITQHALSKSKVITDIESQIQKLERMKDTIANSSATRVKAKVPTRHRQVWEAQAATQAAPHQHQPPSPLVE